MKILRHLTALTLGAGLLGATGCIVAHPGPYHHGGYGGYDGHHSADHRPGHDPRGHVSEEYGYRGERVRERHHRHPYEGYESRRGHPEKVKKRHRRDEGAQDAPRRGRRG